MRRARRGAAGLLGLVALAVAGCGGQHPPSPRAQVAVYIAHVNALEKQAVAPTATVTRISAAISGTHPQRAPAAQVSAWSAQLTAARAQMRTLSARLKTLDPPPAAVRLRSLLESFTAQDLALTDQLRLLIRFIPRFAATLAPTGPALTRLERALNVRSAAGAAAVSAVYAAKAAALRRFQSTASSIADRLTHLTPPAVSAPTYRAQLAALRGMSAGAGHLADALSRGAPGNVTPLLTQFERAALATRTTAVQRAQIAATRAYDRQAAHLTTLAEDIARERLRLAASIH